MTTRVSLLDEPDLFEAPRSADDVVEGLARGLDAGRVDTTSPRYFGHFTSAPEDVALRAEAVASAANPQLATRSHAAFAVACEERVVGAIGRRFGLGADVDGIFTSGGAEANAVALQLALARAFPDLAARGLRALPGDPLLYVSDAGHASVTRAARLAGLGEAAVRVVPTDDVHGMKPTALGELLARDRDRGAIPFLVVATFGTTSSGALDPVAELAGLVERHGLWLHVDAAWGGLAAFTPTLRARTLAFARADSITFDPHKTLGVPLGAGMLLTRHPGALGEVYRERAGYMPRDASRDPYARGPTWSRRFAGAPTFAVLATHGMAGIEQATTRQVALGDVLREGLVARGFRIVNDSPLPVACFVDASHADGAKPRRLEAIARQVVVGGAGWLTLVRLSTGARVLRACITNPQTREEHVVGLLDALVAARLEVDAAAREG